MERNPIAQPSGPVQRHAVALPALEGDDDLQPRRCIRCRAALDDEPTVHMQAQTGDVQAPAGRDWSLCPRCHAVVFPTRTRSAAILTVVRHVEADQPGSDAS